MLQSLNLPFVEITSLENGVNVALTPPVEGFEPVPSFPEIFRLEPHGLPELALDSGMSLPPSGKLLPAADNDVTIESSLASDEQTKLWSRTLPVVLLPLDSLPLMPRLAATAAIPTHTLTSRVDNAIPKAAIPIPSTPTDGDNPMLRLALATVTARNAPVPMNGPVPAAPSATDATPAGPQLAADPLATQSVARSGSDALPAAPRSEVASRVLQQSVQQSATTSKRPVNDTLSRLPRSVGNLPAPLAELNTDDTTGRVKPAQITPQASPMTGSPVTASAMTQVMSALAVADNVDQSSLTQQLQIQPLQATQVPGRTVVDSGTALAPALPVIETPVHDAAWGDRIGDRLLMMAGSKMQVAEIRLSPAELGPLRVQIAIDDGATSVTFHAQHAITREALEQAMPRLRELFADNGLTLGQSNIAESDGQGVPQGKSDQHDAMPLTADPTIDAGNEASADHAASESASEPHSDQLVDTFA